MERKGNESSSKYPNSFTVSMSKLEAAQRLAAAGDGVKFESADHLGGNTPPGGLVYGTTTADSLAELQAFNQRLANGSNG